MLRCRFYVNIEKVKNDYRPVVWPIKLPYWCSGESSEDFILVAYVDTIDDLMKQWPEAHDIESEEVDCVEFTSRFPKPEWYKEETEEELIESTKKLLETSKALLEELDEMKKNVDFLINEYKTNKRWFRDEPGRVTTEDIIKRVFEFGWSCGKLHSTKNEK